MNRTGAGAGAHRTLRAATRAAHDRVDGIFSRADLSCRQGYRRFLQAQAASFIPVEQALDEACADKLLPSWALGARSELLRRDLFEMGESTPSPIARPRFELPEEVWGGIYVLEGSRLGGAVLCRSVSPEFPTSFLGGGSAAGNWRDLLARLEASLVEPAAIAKAIDGALKVFSLFAKAGELYFSDASPTAANRVSVPLPGR